MKRLSVLLAAVLLLLPVLPAGADAGVYNWYEIFVRSFRDSDGDGIGDLAGVTAQLDYLTDMGYDGLWLMPVMPSPSYHKYDVTDYYAIDPEYGTMDDMRALLDAAHSRGMRVIIDLPVNHTSTLHPWFQAACGALLSGRESPYTAWYHFSEKPENASVKLGDSSWYYEEQFAGGGMPDLALENPEVAEEIRAILAFWLCDVGVDGFRLDAVTSFFTGDTDRNVAFLSSLKDMCEELKPGSYLVGECWSNLSTIARYYDSGVDSFFLFPASQAEGFIASSLRGRGTDHAEKFARSYRKVREAIPEGILAPFLSNHDTGRTIGSVQGRGNLPVAKFAEGLLNMLPGCVFTYYGEEIGMAGSQCDPDKRLAMYWSDGDMTQQPPGTMQIEYPYPSVETQKEDPDSLLNYCKKVNEARLKVPAIAFFDEETVSAEGDVCEIRRTLNGKTWIIKINFSSSQTQHYPFFPTSRIWYDLEAIPGRQAVMDGREFHLPPYAIVILEMY